jgi:Domain of unknown function (DUF4129)
LTRCFRLFLSSLVAVWLPVAASTTAAAQPSSDAAVPLDVFLSEIDRLIAAVSAAEAPGAATPVALGVPERWRVDLGGRTVDVSARWLTVELALAAKTPNRWPATRAGIRRRLLEIRSHAALARDDSGAARRAQARAEVSSILAREEFRQSAASQWRERLQQRLGEWFEDLWTRFGGGPAASRRIAIGLAWAAALAALSGLGYFLVRSVAASPGGSPLNLGGADASRPRARDLALRAVAESKAGNARDAVRFAYNAALMRLEEQGAWRVDAARTPREYLPMLGANDARQPLMLDLTQRFERIWYGNRAAAADDTPRVTAHLEALGCLRPGERVI